MTIARQRETLAALGVILERAAGAGLPAIDWRVSNLGSTLVATVPGLGQDDAKENFDLWAGFVERLVRESVEAFGPGRPETMPTVFEPWPARRDAGGYLRLHANGRHLSIALPGTDSTGRRRRVWLLCLALVADVPPDTEAAAAGEEPAP